VSFEELNEERIRRALTLQDPDQVPVYIQFDTLFHARFLGITVQDMWAEPKNMLRAQMKEKETFGGVPELYADYAIIPEATVLGCEVIWPQGTPWIKATTNSLEEATSQDIKDVQAMGLMPRVAETLEYMRKECRGTKIRPFNARSPFMLACMVLGGDWSSITKLSAAMRSQPENVHQFLDLCTRTVIECIRVQAEIIGEFPRLLLSDQFSSYLSPKQFEGFSLPYSRRVFRAFRTPQKWYFNDSDAMHLVELIPKTGADAYAMIGPRMDLALMKRKIGRDVCLVGNVPPESLLRGDAEEVEALARRCVRTAGEGGGYILSPGGVVVEQTPSRNVNALIVASVRFGRYPIANA